MLKPKAKDHVPDVGTKMTGRLLSAICAFAIFMAFAPFATYAKNVLANTKVDAKAGTKANTKSASKLKNTAVTPSPKKLIKAALGEYLATRLAKDGFEVGAPILIRIFKETSELEIWLADKKDGGKFRRFNTYSICKWSGKIGPKLSEGDRQSPEGFYAFSPWNLRAHHRNFRAIDIGYPNDLDEAMGRTGSDIQIHGGCGSSGCFAMTDERVDEIFRLTAAAFGGGQREIMVHAFPFRMTKTAMAKRQKHPWMGFWKNLKEIDEAFKTSRKLPKISICDKKYTLNAPAQGPVKCKLLKAPTITVAARRRALARAARPASRIKIRCNLRRPSCKKWLFLQKRILARKDAAKARKASRTARR